jgi:hypothetical protein
MGTRTWSRKGVLTAAGRRRQASLGVNQQVLTTGKNKLLNILTAGDRPLIINDNPSAYEQIAKAISNASKSDIDGLIEEQLSRPISANFDKAININVLRALALYAPSVDQRLRIIEFVDKNGNGRLSELNGFLYNKSMDAWALRGEKAFIEKFWRAWSGHELLPKSVWGQMQQYFSKIGPNTEHAAPLDFYPAGIKPPKLNPAIIRMLKKEYTRTQRMLKKMGYPEDGVTLYRGTTQPPGLGLESWSDLKSTGELFAGSVRFSGQYQDEGELRVQKVPRNLIFGSWNTIKGWADTIEPNVTGKQEYMVLGTALAPEKRAPATSRVPRNAMAGREFRERRDLYEAVLNV